jgi:hypothetical protein
MWVMVYEAFSLARKKRSRVRCAVRKEIFEMPTKASNFGHADSPRKNRVLAQHLDGVAVWRGACIPPYRNGYNTNRI